MASTRQTFLETIRTRLQAIRVTSGYLTDAGETVFLGETPNLGPDDPDTALAIVPGDAVVTKTQGKKRYMLLPVEIQVVTKVDRDEPWIAVEQALADVQTAIEQDDVLIHGYEQSLSYASERVLPREEGMTTTGAGITYALTWCQAWGAP